MPEFHIFSGQFLKVIGSIGIIIAAGIVIFKKGMLLPKPEKKE
jgi:hypothetical protein